MEIPRLAWWNKIHVAKEPLIEVFLFLFARSHSNGPFTYQHNIAAAISVARAKYYDGRFDTKP